jgi:hypothetical protein
MLFNVDKYKVMHIGQNSNKANYEMNGKYLDEVTDEREQRVIIQNDSKFSKQCLKAVSTADRVLGMIISVRDKDMILQLCKSLVRPHLEYNIQVCRLHYHKRYRHD